VLSPFLSPFPDPPQLDPALLVLLPYPTWGLFPAFFFCAWLLYPCLPTVPPLGLLCCPMGGLLRPLLLCCCVLCPGRGGYPCPFSSAYPFSGLMPLSWLVLPRMVASASFTFPFSLSLISSLVLSRSYALTTRCQPLAFSFCIQVSVGLCLSLLGFGGCLIVFLPKFLV